MLEQEISLVASTFKKYFPNTVLIPSLGNNDFFSHYQAPSETDKQEYLNFVYDAFFTNSTTTKPDSKETFLYAGYYRIDISP